MPPLRTAQRLAEGVAAPVQMPPTAATPIVLLYSDVRVQAGRYRPQRARVDEASETPPLQIHSEMGPHITPEIGISWGPYPRFGSTAAPAAPFKRPRRQRVWCPGDHVFSFGIARRHLHSRVPREGGMHICRMLTSGITYPGARRQPTSGGGQSHRFEYKINYAGLRELASVSRLQLVPLICAGVHTHTCRSKGICVEEVHDAYGPRLQAWPPRGS